MPKLKLVEHENFGNYETIISDAYFIEVRVEGKIHSIWYGCIEIPSNIEPEIMKNPVEYIEKIKSYGYKKLETKRANIGKQL